MLEPSTNTALAVAVGASSASFAAGTVLGVEYIVYGLALLGGATALIYLERMHWKQMLWSIVGSTVLGVVLASLGAYLIIPTIVHFMPWLDNALHPPYLPAKILIAFVGGFLAQKGVPILFRWMESKGSQK
jgi:hypothetical protein